ncbi:hypothetical protein F6R98_10405 [Candidatus Methylospira mobilis]|uniref:Uncharacterized protein n=1 Tax=Candidatus Methylospira mobilis TaxID=1808979 RepID=A0A5Q0BGJ7_9GAMM|nr:hypothetical protein F6R98_10405 [Candidatus Methylospira mobilis]
MRKGETINPTTAKILTGLLILPAGVVFIALFCVVMAARVALWRACRFYLQRTCNVSGLFQVVAGLFMSCFRSFQLRNSGNK